MRSVMMAAAAVLAMAGTAAGAADAQGRRPSRVQTISYETGACFGTCPIYKVTVSSDGRGVFEGERFTGVVGRRDFRVTPAQWRAFRDRLQALHGRGTVDLSDPSKCELFASDMPTVEVRWSGAWRPHTLRMNYGCEGERYGWMQEHLRRAPEALPIARFVKPDRPIPPSR